MTSKTRRILLLTGLALYSVLVFVVDLFTPLGIEDWVLNLPVILMPVLFRQARLVVVLTLACSATLALGSVYSPVGANPRWWDVLNRGMGLAAMWLIAALAIGMIKKSIRLTEAVDTLRAEIAEHAKTRRTLELHEERLHLAVEGAGMGTFDVNLQTGKVVWSATHMRMLGYEEVSDRETTVERWQARVHPEDLDRVLEARQEALRRRSAYTIEYRINRADNGKVEWLAVFGRYHYNESGEAVRFLGVSFPVTRRKELEREVLEIAAREQRQIGQELHDGVGQELTGLGLMAQTLAQLLAGSAEGERIACRLLAGLDRVQHKVRELSRGLIPVHVESRGLAAALTDLAASTTQASGVSVTAECPEWVELPDPTAATQLFRIAQEAVTNAVRHGRPRHIRLTLLTEPNGLRLRINDDGVGIQREPDRCDGLGLRIMEYRAGLIGGVLRVTPPQGGGTVVTCTLPRSQGNGYEAYGSGFDQGKGLDRG
jgi:PAS domain S-box-containing protein